MWKQVKKLTTQVGGMSTNTNQWHARTNLITMSIYKKLLDIQKAIDFLKKNQDGHQYRYVDGTRVLSAIRPLMNKHGLILKQEITSANHEVITYATRNGEKTEVLAKVMFLFTWVDSETGETDVNKWAADGMNGFDKGIGSAMTYAERYFLIKYFHIPTDELDNDALGDKSGQQQGLDKRLRSAKTLDELKNVWMSLSAQQQVACTHIKDEVKSKLT